MELEGQSSVQVEESPAQQGAQSYLFPLQLFPSPAMFSGRSVGFRGGFWGERSSDKRWEWCSRGSSGPHCEPLSYIWYYWKITSAQEVIKQSMTSINFSTEIRCRVQNHSLITESATSSTWIINFKEGEFCSWQRGLLIKVLSIFITGKILLLNEKKK